MSSPHFSGKNSLLFINNRKIYQLKAKNVEIKDYAPCLDIHKYLTERT